MGLRDEFYSLVGLGVSALALLVTTSVTIPNEARAVSLSDGTLAERWGEFDWLSPWIETSAIYQEPRSGEFVLSGASFGGRWTGRSSRDLRLEAQVAVGTRSLISKPLRYAPLSGSERTSDPVIVDAFAGFISSWGRLRFGLVPIVFGLEEGQEQERRWLRPLVLRQGLMGLRDLGVSYSINAGGFYSDWLVHNGESGDDRDREMWVTSRAEYRFRTDRTAWRAGLSGQVGRTTAAATHPTGTTATATELNPDQSSRMRLGGLHAAVEWAIGAGERGSIEDRRFALELELFSAEITQDIRSRRMRGMRFDVEWEPWTRVGLMSRYDMLDPDVQIDRDATQEFSIGAQAYVLEGALKRSMRFILVGTKEWIESRAPDRHRVELVFRFSPEF